MFLWQIGKPHGNLICLIIYLIYSDLKQKELSKILGQISSPLSPYSPKRSQIFKEKPIHAIIASWLVRAIRKVLFLLGNLTGQHNCNATLSSDMSWNILRVTSISSNNTNLYNETTKVAIQFKGRNFGVAFFLWFVFSSKKISTSWSISSVFFVKYSFFALFWTSELMSRKTFGSDVAQDNTTQGLEYPGYTSAGKEDKLMYQSPLNRSARIFLWSETH